MRVDAEVFTWMGLAVLWGFALLLARERFILAGVFIGIYFWALIGRSLWISLFEPSTEVK